MSEKDLYKVLGVSKSSSPDEIKKAYEQFKEITNAYEILSDPKKRQQYDQFGSASFQHGGFGGGAGPGAEGFGDIFESVFKDFFGGGAGRRASAGPQRGNDLMYQLELDLEQVVRGTTVDIQVRVPVSCQTCYGKGTQSGAAPSTCTYCQGTGQIRMQQGFFSIQQPCHYCQGKGTVIKDPCKTCHGAGRVEKEQKLSVNIPAGVTTGDRLRLSGKGEAGAQGGPAGDLYVEIHIRPHPIFQREGSNLYVEVPIPFTVAALGGNVDVPSLEGPLSLKIPAGTQTNKVFKLGQKGIPQNQRHAAGDLMCRVVIETPVHLTNDQKALLEKFAEITKDSIHHPVEKKWWDRIKGFFEKIKKP